MHKNKIVYAMYIFVIRQPHWIGVLEYPCTYQISSHISYLILTFLQSLSLISCILYLGGSLRGGMSSPPPDPFKVPFKLIMPYLLDCTY